MLWHFLSARGFLLLCGFYAYVQMILILKPQEKKFNLFFIRVQPLPCQSNPFTSLSVDCSCQSAMTTRYLDNSLLMIPTSEKLPFANYIATNEAQMHLLRCPLSLVLSVTHGSQTARPALASERRSNRRLGFRAQTQRRSPVLRAGGNQVFTTLLPPNKLSPKVWESDESSIIRVNAENPDARPHYNLG